jgi:hypothetical protein
MAILFPAPDSPVTMTKCIVRHPLGLMETWLDNAMPGAP